MTHSVWDEAEALYQEILAGEIEDFGPDHPEALKTRALLIRCDYFLRRTTLLEAQRPSRPSPTRSPTTWAAPIPA
jgi:hypothetical protein